MQIIRIRIINQYVQFLPRPIQPARWTYLLPNLRSVGRILGLGKVNRTFLVYD